MNKYQRLIATLRALEQIKQVADPVSVDVSSGNKLLVTLANTVYTQYGVEAGTFRYTIKIPLFDHTKFTVTLNWSEMTHSVKHYVQQAGITASVLEEQWLETIDYR